MLLKKMPPTAQKFLKRIKYEATYNSFAEFHFLGHVFGSCLIQCTGCH